MEKRIKIGRIRWGIMLLLVAFGMLIASATIYAVRFSHGVALYNEYGSVRGDLDIIAHDISVKMDDGATFEESFSFIEMVAKVQESEENFSYVVRDASGVIVSPSFTAGRMLEMRNVRLLSDDGNVMTADVWGARCFVVLYEFPDRPLELVAIYDSNYMFRNQHMTVTAFILLISSVFLVLLLLAWFWIIPSLERTLDRRKKAEKELEIAAGLQQRAVTRIFPSDSRCDIFAVLHPAKEVGGDLYHCLRSGDKLYFAVGDVSDKGTAAAFVMFLISSLIHSRLGRDFPLGGIMREINVLLYDNPAYEMFCTVFLGSIDLNTYEMEYCNAGHTRGILDGEFIEQDPQLMAGIVSDFEYHTQKIRLHRGSRLLLYTDGVTEARGAGRSFFGEKGLLEWMRRQPFDDSCEKTCNGLISALTSFRGAEEQSDDIAIMCIKI